MNLPKAKAALAQMIVYQYSAHQSEEGDAVKFGLQAILRVECLRAGQRIQPDTLLPGETVE